MQRTDVNIVNMDLISSSSEIEESFEEMLDGN